jgi:EmrB/QacA subfamily drug resistance transporter
MIALMLSLLLAALDTTIVGPAMSTIGRDLGDFPHLPWVVTAYLLVSTTLTPLYGKLSDIHGRRIMLLIAIGSFVAGSAACALAPSLLALAAARGLQGVGGAGIAAMTMTIIGDIVPVPQRPKYQNYTALVWIVANLVGPVVGGDLAAWASWRMIFWINLPLGVLAWVMASGRLKRIPRREKRHRLDYLGAGLLIGAASLTVLSLSASPAPGSYAPRAALAGVAVAFWTLLVWRQARAAEPLIPLSVLSNRVVVAGMLASGFTMAAYLGLAVFAPIFYQTTLGLSVAQAGAATLPLMVGSAVGSSLAARLMLRVRNYWIIARLGLMAAAAASATLAVVNASAHLLAIEGLWVVVAIGAGPIFPILNVSIQAAVKPHELGTSMSLITFFRNLGAAFGVALLGGLVIGSVAADLEPSAHAGSAGALASHSFNGAFAAVAASFVLASAALMLASGPPLREAQVTEAAVVFE